MSALGGKRTLALVAETAKNILSPQPLTLTFFKLRQDFLERRLDGSRYAPRRKFGEHIEDRSKRLWIKQQWQEQCGVRFVQPVYYGSNLAVA